MGQGSSQASVAQFASAFGCSSPPRGAITQVYVCFVQFLQIDSFLGYFTLLEVSNVVDSILFGLLK